MFDNAVSIPIHPSTIIAIKALGGILLGVTLIAALLYVVLRLIPTDDIGDGDE